MSLVTQAAYARRHGVSADAVPALAERVLALPGLALDGLMTVAPAGDAGEAARSHFRTLRELRNHVASRLGVELPHLSMGMSEDFVVALRGYVVKTERPTGSKTVRARPAAAAAENGLIQIVRDPV